MTQRCASARHETSQPLARAPYADDPVGKPNPVKATLMQVRIIERYEMTRISWKGGLIDLLV